MDGAYFGEDKHKLSGSLRGRIGYAYERFLPYLHGGVAWSRNEHMLGCESPSPFSSCAAPGFERQESDTVTGYVLGAGLEYAIDQRWSIKGEYAYTNYGKNKLVLVDPNFPDNPVNNRNFETKNHTLKLGVNYRF